jgi:hypothetical protein
MWSDATIAVIGEPGRRRSVANDLRNAFHALQSDPQVASRFEPLLLPRWTEVDAFRSFVMGVWSPPALA